MSSSIGNKRLLHVVRHLAENATCVPDYNHVLADLRSLDELRTLICRTQLQALAEGQEAMVTLENMADTVEKMAEVIAGLAVGLACVYKETGRPVDFDDTSVPTQYPTVSGPVPIARPEAFTPSATSALFGTTKKETVN